MKKLKNLGLLIVVATLALASVACGKEEASVSSNEMTTTSIEESPNVITGDVENAVIAPTGTYVHSYDEEIEGETLTRNDWIVLYDDGTGYMINQDAVKIDSYIAGAFVMGDLTYVYEVDGDTLAIVVDGNRLVYTKTTESLPQDVQSMIEQ